MKIGLQRLEADFVFYNLVYFKDFIKFVGKLVLHIIKSP